MNLRELELAIRKEKEAQHGKYGYGAKEAKELAKLITPGVADLLVSFWAGLGVPLTPDQADQQRQKFDREGLNR